MSPGGEGCGIFIIIINFLLSMLHVILFPVYAKINNLVSAVIAVTRF